MIRNRDPELFPFDRGTSLLFADVISCGVDLALNEVVRARTGGVDAQRNRAAVK